jgi:peptide/nickel transport system permease protein
MNNEDDTNPSATAELTDQGQGHAPEELANQGYSAAGEVSLLKKRRGFGENIWRGLKTAPPTALFGLTVITIYVIFAVFASLLAPYGEAEIFPMSYAPWSDEFMFGTDQLGRDVLSRLIYGARNTVGIAFVTTLFAFTIGGGLGITAAINNNGWLDQLLSRSVDVLMAIPSLIFALILLSMFGATTLNLIVIIAVLDSTRVFRIARAVSLNVVVMDYVEAARLRGEGMFWILYREILPNIMPPLVAEFGLRFCFVFLTIAALSFLGVGIQPPTADWGSMVRETAGLIQFAEYDLTAAMTPMLPAAAIALLTVAVNFVVDWFLHKSSGLKD